MELVKALMGELRKPIIVYSAFILFASELIILTSPTINDVYVPIYYRLFMGLVVTLAAIVGLLVIIGVNAFLWFVVLWMNDDIGKEPTPANKDVGFE